MGDRVLARSLGWFSLALGAAEIAAPGRLRGWFRAGDQDLIRLYGVREVAAGVALLALPSPAPGLWARVGGDALDLVSLGNLLGSRGADRGRVTGAIGSIVAISAVDVVTALRHSGRSRSGPVAVERSLTIGRPAGELYDLLADPETVARVAGPALTFEADGDGRQRWELRPATGKPVKWTTTLAGQEPGSRIAWATGEGSAVTGRAEVRFRPAPADWGTVATLAVTVRKGAPAGLLGGPLGSRAGEIALAQLLHRFKSLAETGEIPTLSGQPAARNDGRDR